MLEVIEKKTPGDMNRYFTLISTYAVPGRLKDLESLKVGKSRIVK